MSQYIAGSGLSYKQYLQTRSFVDQVCWTVTDSALRIGGSINALQNKGAQIERSIDNSTNRLARTITEEGQTTRRELQSGLSEVSRGLERGFADIGERMSDIDQSLGAINASVGDVRESIEEGFYNVRFELRDISREVRDMSALFDFRLAELQTQMGAMADTLEALKQIAKSPEQAWAYEQYEMAKVALRRKLHGEALTYVSRAIRGHQSHTGYLLDHRFHRLEGVILSTANEEVGDILDLAGAKAAFLAAARYAETDEKQEAARAMCSAGFVAYCQGDVDGCEDLSQRAIKYYPNLSGAHFQLAKACFHKRKVDDALQHLRGAVLLDPLYSVRCFDDGDFMAYRPNVEGMIVDLSEQKRTAVVGRAKGIRETANGVVSQLIGSAPSFKLIGARGEQLLSEWANNFRGISEKAVSLINATAPGPLPYIDVQVREQELLAMEAGLLKATEGTLLSIDDLKNDSDAVFSAGEALMSKVGAEPKMTQIREFDRSAIGNPLAAIILLAGLADTIMSLGSTKEWLDSMLRFLLLIPVALVVSHLAPLTVGLFNRYRLAQAARGHERALQSYRETWRNANSDAADVVAGVRRELGELSNRIRESVIRSSGNGEGSAV